MGIEIVTFVGYSKKSHYSLLILPNIISLGNLFVSFCTLIPQQFIRGYFKYFADCQKIMEALQSTNVC